MCFLGLAFLAKCECVGIFGKTNPLFMIKETMLPSHSIKLIYSVLFTPLDLSTITSFYCCNGACSQYCGNNRIRMLHCPSTFICHKGLSIYYVILDRWGGGGVFPIYPARARSAQAQRACALRALGLLLADGAPTVGRGKTF